MALTLTSDIAATARTISVTGTVPDVIGPGYAFRLDDELLMIFAFEFHDVSHTLYRQWEPNRNVWMVRRGQGGSVVAPHTAGTTIFGASDAFTASGTPSTPIVFPEGGPGGGSALEVLDEGVSLDSAVTSLDFTGSGVTATQTAAGAIEVSLTGGGGGGATVTVSDTDPGAIGAGNLWYRTDPEGNWAPMLWVRNADDTNWVDWDNSGYFGGLTWYDDDGVVRATVTGSDGDGIYLRTFDALGATKGSIHIGADGHIQVTSGLLELLGSALTFNGADVIKQATDPGDIADPSVATPEDVANAYNTLLANLRAEGLIA